MKKFYGSTAIILSMILGIGAGILLNNSINFIAPLGELFIKLLKMLIVPLVFFNILSGAISLGKTNSAGKIGFLTLFYYLLTSCLAVVIGIGSGLIFKPGLGINVPKEFLTSESTYEASKHGAGIFDTLLNIIPDNIFTSLMTANILQIICFTLFLGLCIAKLPNEKQQPLIDILDVINEALIKMVEKVLIVAPIGVFALMANSVALFGIDIIFLVTKLFLVFTLALSLIHFGILPGLVGLFTKVSPVTFIKETIPAQIFAFSTASSIATLPINTECCKKIGVSNTTTSFILPLGATINMNGNAMLYGLTAVFFSQMFNISLGINEYLAIIFTSVLGAVGTAGIPGPSLLVVAVLVAAHVPLIALPLVLGIDRILDMMRTSTNILGDASCAVIMDQLVNKKNKSFNINKNS